MLQQIDLNFLDTPETIASFLLPIGDGEYALFETGPHSTFKHLERALNNKGIKVSDVKHVFLTHIHLDHAGAAWAFAEAGAKVYVHPKGYPHLIDPSKLLHSAKRIYQDQMDYLWGAFKPIPSEKLEAVSDLQEWKFGDLSIKAHFTPGHAVHHIAWQVETELVAGDVAGVKIGDGPVMPPCPPPDINLEDWDVSINRIKSLGLSAIHLTHFGPITNIDRHLDDLNNRLRDWANWIHPYFLAERDQREIVPLFQAYVQQQLVKEGVDPDELGKYEKANPSWMSVAGLMRYWKKRTTA